MTPEERQQAIKDLQKNAPASQASGTAAPAQ
jgi:hypothetical protein